MKRVGVGIVGFGNVGGATAGIISQNADLIEQRTGIRLEVAVVCRRTTVQPQDVPKGARYMSNWEEVVRCPEVEVLVETMGGMDESLRLVRSGLEQGKPVVTANKNLLAEHGDELFALATARNLPIGFEASVAAGIPVLRVIHESTTGDRLRAVYGIVNGTVNYILTQMENRGIDFEQALEEAQRAGYAEPDPSFDIDGIDARDKLCLLARMAFGGRLNTSRIPTSGVRQVRAVDLDFAKRLNSTIRLVVSAEETEAGLELSVRPWIVGRCSMLAKVEGPNNAVFLVGKNIGTQMYYGRGAGGDTTGVAVVSDLIEIARDLTEGRLRAKVIPGFKDSHELKLCQNPRPVRWYLRLTTKKQSGILGEVTEIFARHEIEVGPLTEVSAGRNGSCSSAAVTVGPVHEARIRRVVDEINALPFMAEPVLLLRMSNDCC